MKNNFIEVIINCPTEIIYYNAIKITMTVDVSAEGTIDIVICYHVFKEFIVTNFDLFIIS